LTDAFLKGDTAHAFWILFDFKKVFTHFSKDFESVSWRENPKWERITKVCKIHHDFSHLKKSKAFNWLLGVAVVILRR